MSDEATQSKQRLEVSGVGDKVVVKTFSKAGNLMSHFVVEREDWDEAVRNMYETRQPGDVHPR